MAQAAYAGDLQAHEASGSHSARLSAENARHIRDSYRLIEPVDALVATLFFRRLNDTAPEVRPFLAGCEAVHRERLRVALGLAVASVDRFGDIVSPLRLLGARYRALGVTEYHYGAVAEAFMWTLRQSLGAHWTAEVEHAWTALFTLIAETMTASD